MGSPGWKVYNLQFIINSLLFRVNSLQLISREFDDKLQISFDFLGGFVEKRNFGGKVERLIEIKWNRLYLTLLR